MDLTIPYTFYPLALPHWMAWVFFAATLLGGAAAAVAGAQRGGWVRGLQTGAACWGVLLIASMMASMVVTFFVHDL
jgi:hypothetical protein